MLSVKSVKGNLISFNKALLSTVYRNDWLKLTISCFFAIQSGNYQFQSSSPIIWFTFATTCIVFEVIRTISSLLIFLRKASARKKTPKRKRNDFYPLRSFCAREKLLSLVVFCSLIFVLLVNFCLIYVFCVAEIFS